MGRWMIVAGLLVVASTACGGGGEPAPDGGTAAPDASEDQAAEGDTITGTFDADAQLEGGCAWVDDGETRWQVLWPPDYELTLDPPTLTGPDGLQVAEGDTITVAGSEPQDVVTTCQIGPVWQATSVTAGGG